jgi:hypothetical protein
VARLKSILIASGLAGTVALSAIFWRETHRAPPKPPEPAYHSLALLARPSPVLKTTNGKLVLAFPFSCATSGLPGKVQFSARDGAGQTGLSAPSVVFTIPGRTFTHPIARLLGDLCQSLTIDETQRAPVAREIATLLRDHADIIPTPGSYAGLETAQRKLATDSSATAVRDAQKIISDVMIDIESNAMSATERALREADRKLSETLNQNAKDSKVNEARKELENKFEKYLQEKAQQQNQQKPNSALSDQQLSKDMDQLRKTMDELAKQNAKDAARKLQQQVEQMMQKLQQQENQQSQQQTNKGSRARKVSKVSKVSKASKASRIRKAASSNSSSRCNRCSNR